MGARQKFAVIRAAADTDELLDLVIVRSEIGVMDGPRNFVAIGGWLLQIRFGIAQADASPNVGFATAAPDAPEIKILAVGG